jgi:hypothetical protein
VLLRAFPVEREAGKVYESTVLALRFRRFP